MRRILATVVLALSALLGLPATAEAGGPTSVLVTRTGAAAGALYYSDEAYDALARLLPAADTRGRTTPPRYAGEGYHLTWMIHDVTPWRFDRLQLGADGNLWVSTTSSANVSGEWTSLGPARPLRRLLESVVDDAGPDVVSVPAAGEPSPAAPSAAEPAEEDASWFSLSGWRWVVPGALLGLVVGAAAAHRRGEDEPRRVLISS